VIVEFPNKNFPGQNKVQNVRHNGGCKPHFTAVLSTLSLRIFRFQQIFLLRQEKMTPNVSTNQPSKGSVTLNNFNFS